MWKIVEYKVINNNILTDKTKFYLTKLAFNNAVKVCKIKSNKSEYNTYYFKAFKTNDPVTWKEVDGIYPEG